MRLTAPIGTPRNLTGAPSLRPLREVSKYSTYSRLLAKNLDELKSMMPATSRTAPLTMKAPTTVGFAFLLMVLVVGFCGGLVWRRGLVLHGLVASTCKELAHD